MKRDPNELRGPLKAYSRYLSLAIQMGVLIGAGAWGGRWLDQRMHLSKPAWGVVGTLLGLLVGLYFILKAVKEDEKG